LDNNNETRIVMHPSPVPRTLRSINLKNFHVMLGGGIINPFGPTLTVAGLEGGPDPREFAVVQIMLNPFSRWVREVGTATLGETCSIQSDFMPLFGLEWGSCPSLLLSSRMFEEDFVEQMYAKFLGSLENGQHLLEGVRRCPGDPFKRIEVDMQAMGVKGARIRDGKLTEAEAGELAGCLLKPEMNKQELKAFLGAWDGSLRFQRRGLFSRKPMSLKEFAGLLGELGISCRLPQ
jgi:hypothetical protein